MRLLRRIPSWTMRSQSKTFWTGSFVVAPPLHGIFIAETSFSNTAIPDLSRRSPPNNKLITSSSIQAFPRRLTLSKSSRTKPFLDLAGRRRRKQGFDSPRLHTAKYCPWQLAIYSAVPSKQKALELERYLKSGSRREFLQRHVAVACLEDV